MLASKAIVGSIELTEESKSCLLTQYHASQDWLILAQLPGTAKVFTKAKGGAVVIKISFELKGAHFLEAVIHLLTQMASKKLSVKSESLVSFLNPLLSVLNQNTRSFDFPETKAAEIINTFQKYLNDASLVKVILILMEKCLEKGLGFFNKFIRKELTDYSNSPQVASASQILIKDFLSLKSCKILIDIKKTTYVTPIVPDLEQSIFIEQEPLSPKSKLLQILNECFSEKAKQNPRQKKCRYNFITEALDKQLPNVNSLDVIQVVEAIEKIPNELVHKSLVPPGYHSNCEHQPPLCPKNENQKPNARQMMLDFLLEKVNSIKTLTWSDCIDQFNHVPSAEAQDLFLVNYWKVRNKIIIKDMPLNEGVTILVNCTNDQHTSLIYYLCCLEIFRSPTLADGCLKKYTERGQSNLFDLTQYLRKLFSKVDPILGMNQEWPNICEYVIETAMQTIERYTMNIEQANILSAIDMFFKASHNGQVKTEAVIELYGSLINLKHINQPDKEKMIEYCREANQKAGTSFGVFKKLLSSENEATRYLIDCVKKDIIRDLDTKLISNVFEKEPNTHLNVLQTLKDTETASCQSCFEDLAGKLVAFFLGVYEENMKFDLYLQISNHNMQEELWKYVNPIVKLIASTLINRIPNAWKKNRYMQSFKEMESISNSYEGTRKFLQELANNFEACKYINMETVELDALKLNQRETLVMSTIKEIHNRYSFAIYVKRFNVLCRFPYYLILFKMRLPEFTAKPTMSLMEFNQECEGVEQMVNAKLKAIICEYTPEALTTLESSRSWLESEESHFLVDYEMLSETSLFNVKTILATIQLNGQLKEVFDCLRSLEEFLIKEGKLQNLESLESSNICQTLRIINEKLRTQAKNNQRIDLSDEEKDLGHLIGGSVKLIMELNKCKELFSHFKNTKPRHFNDLLTGGNSIYAITPEEITTLRDMIETYGSKDVVFPSLLDFVKAFRMRDFKNIASLPSIQQQLIDASNDLVEDSSDKAKKGMKDILDHSTILFKLENDHYNVFCALSSDPKQCLDKNFKLPLKGASKSKNSSAEAGSSQCLTLNELIDYKIKLSMLQQAKSGKDQEIINMAIEKFLPIIESVEGIQQNLTELRRAGTIFNLEMALRDAIPKAGHNLGCLTLVEAVSQFYMIKNQSLAIKTSLPRTSSLSVTTSIVNFDDANVDHFKLIKNALELILTETNQWLLTFRSCHAFLILDPSQRLLLCDYIDSIKKPSKRNFDSCEIESILEYVSNTARSNDLLSTFEMPLSTFNDIEESYLTDQILSTRLDRIYKTPPSNPIKNSKIQFFGYPKQKDNEIISKFRLLYDLMDSYKMIDWAPWQFFFANPNTNLEEISLFLMRALFDPSDRFYFALDLHLLSEKCSSGLVQHIKKYVDKNGAGILNMNLILIFRDEGRGAYLFSNLLLNPNLYESIHPFKLQHSGDKSKLFKDLRNKLKTKVVESKTSGMGKTYYIEKSSADAGSHLRTILLASDASTSTLERRLELIQANLIDSLKFSLHIKLDMMDNMHNSCELIDQILFSFCFLKCHRFKNGYLFFNQIEQYYIEIQNSYHDLLLKNVSMFDLCEKHTIIQPDSNERLSEAMDTSKLKFFLDQRKVDTMEKLVTFLTCLTLPDYLGKYNLDTAYEKLKSEKRMIVNTKSLVDKISVLSNSFVPKSYTMAQLITLIKVLTFQAVQMDSVPSLNPQLLNPDRIMQKMLSSTRITAGTLIVLLSNELVWGSTLDIRKETEITKTFLKDYEATSERSVPTSEELKHFVKQIGSIKKWENSSSLNIFFYGNAMKIIYKDLNAVDKEIQALVYQLAGKNALVDFKNLDPEKLMSKLIEELMEALDLTTKLKPPVDFMPLEKQHDARRMNYMKQQVKGFRGKGYVITHDNYLKILMIVQRADLQIPIVIMGATGCGKTYMIEFICKCLLEEAVRCITLHSGYKEVDLIAELSAIAEMAANNPSKRHWVMFDEFNTSPLQCLIAEIMTERRSTSCVSWKGQKFPDNLVLVAACNPYRIQASATTVGLVHESSAAILSHRVYPIPDTLINYIWDFGQLSDDTEMQYVMCMLNTFIENDKKIIARVIITSQNFLRRVCSESSVSLRDVSRFIELVHHFGSLFDERNLEQSVILAAHICYLLRLDDSTIRTSLYAEIDPIFGPGFDAKVFFEGFLELFTNEVKRVNVLSPGIYFNKPLKENLFASVTCIRNKIPIIICGKPGTSKSLTISVCQELFNLPIEVKQRSRFFKSLPSLYLVDFWGAQNTTSEAVIKAFAEAKQKAEEIKGPNIVCLNFDEIGLAEVSPDNPLKVLHPLLEPEKQTIAFYGTSNWRLDQSKMNRVIFISRPDMTDSELRDTCRFQDIPEGELRDQAEEAAMHLSIVYKAFRDTETSNLNTTHPNFHGSRDFYEAIKGFKNSIKTLSGPLSSEFAKFNRKSTIECFMVNSIQRCFGGKLINNEPSESYVIKLYLEQSREDPQSSPPAEFIKKLKPSSELIYQNLIDTECRHMMILTDSPNVEELVVAQICKFETEVRKKEHSRIECLFYTEGREDLPGIFISRLPVFVKQGYTIILKNLDAVYGSMYDLLNLNYTNTVRDIKKCNLFYGDHKGTMTVHPEFKCIILMDRQDKIQQHWETEKKQPPPFLNRFEKYLILKNSVIPEEKQKVLDQLKMKYLKPATETNPISSKYLIHNLSQDLLTSIALKDSTEMIDNLAFKQRGKAISTDFMLLDLLNNLLELTQKHDGKMKEKTSPIVKRDISSLSTEVLLARLYSQNVVISRAIKAQASGKPEDERKFRMVKEVFLQTHPHNSIFDLINFLKQPTAPSKRAIVFTWTSSWELREITENRKDVVVFECSPVHINRVFGRDFTLNSIVDSDNVAIIFQFNCKKDWHLIRHVRFHIENLSKAHYCPIILVAHATPEDLTNEIENDSSISFFNKSWQMVVIEDLKGCYYKQLFEKLDKPCLEFLTVVDDECREGRENLLDSIIQGGLNAYFLSKSTNPRNLERAVQCKKVLEQNQNLLFQLKEALKQNEKGQAKLSSIIDERDLAERLKQKLDAESIFESFLKQHFEGLVVKAMNYLNDKVSLDLFGLSNLLEESMKQAVIYSIESALEINNDSLEMSNPFISNHCLQYIPKLDFKLTEFKRKYKRRVVELQESKHLIDSKKKVVLSGLTEIYLETPSPAMIKGDLNMDSWDSEMLAALFMLDRYLEANVRSISKDLILEIVARMATICIPSDVSKRPVNGTANLLALMVSIVEVYEAEFNLLVGIMGILQDEDIFRLRRVMLASFKETGLLDASSIIQTLQALLEIETKTDLSKIIQNFRLMENFKKESNDDGISNPGERLIIRLLEFIRNLEDTNTDDFKNSKSVFNKVIKANNQDFAYVSTQFLHDLAKEKGLPRAQLRRIMREVSGHLFDVSIYPNQHQNVTANILSFLFMLLSEDNMEENTQIINLISRIICSLYLRNKDPGWFNTAKDRLFTSYKDKSLKREVFEIFNQRVLRDFDLIIESGWARRSEPQNIEASLLEFYKVMNKRTDSPTGELLDLEFINAVAWLKSDIAYFTKNPTSITSTQASKIDALITDLYNEGTNPKNSKRYAFYLLFSSLIFNICKETSMIKHIGFNQLGRCLEAWGGHNRIQFLIPDGSLALRIERDISDQSEKQDERKMAALCRNADFRLHTLNIIFKYFRVDRQLTSRHLNMMRSVEPLYMLVNSSFRCLEQLKPNQQGVESPENTDLTNRCQQAQRRCFLIGAVLNLMLSLPNSNSLCWDNVYISGQEPILINYPTKDLLKLLPIVAYFTSQKTTFSVQWNTSIGDFNALWRCQTPNCGYLFPIGDCGKIAGANERANNRGAAKCPGCGNLNGANGTKNPNMERVNLTEVVANVKKALAVDDQQYRKEPDGNNDSSWIIDKYTEQVKTQGAALFLKVIQSCMEFLYHTRSSEFNLVGNSENLLKKIDIQVNGFERFIEKDVQTTFTYMILKIWRLETSNAKQAIISPEDLRKRVSDLVDTNANQINKEITNYFRVKAENFDKAIVEDEKKLNLIKNCTQEAIEEEIGVKSLSDMWALTKIRESYSLAQIEDRLQEMKEQGSDRAEFLLTVLNMRDLLNQWPKIIITIRRLEEFLTNRFDTRYSEEDSLKITIDSLIKEENAQMLQQAAGKAKLGSSYLKEGELEKEFNTFSRIWKENIMPLLMKHEKRFEFKFECQEIDRFYELLQELSNRGSVLGMFVCSKNRDKDIKTVLMRSLLEALVKLQEKMIESFIKFTSQGTSPPLEPPTISLNILTAPKSAFMCLLSDVQQDLKQHTQPIQSTIGHETLKIDVDYLSNKYAHEMFGGAMLLKVIPNFYFSDGDERNLFRLIENLEGKVKILNPTLVNMKQLQELGWLTINHAEEIQNHKLALQVAIVQSMEAGTSQPSSKIVSFLPEDMRRLIFNERLERATLEQVKLVVWKLYEQAYSEALKKAKTLQKPESDKNEKSKIPPQRGLQGLKLEQDDREKWVWLLKSAYSKAVLDATEGSSPLEEPLRDAVDEEWEKQIDQFKTAAGLAPEQSLTFGDVPQLISLLSSSKN